MRSSITSLILLAITVPTQAQDNKTKPNTLTDKEIADGWILLLDGETSFGWRLRGNATFANGMLTLEKKEPKSGAVFTTNFHGDLLQEWQYAGRNLASNSWQGIGMPKPIGNIEFHALPGMALRSVKVRLKPGEPLFNGKDLTGWKTFPGDKYKSIFTVTDKGELNVKNGPGDLQTTGKYQDFVLQLECISHGKHLNSGIFFRCRDNEYQNGYEAQIRNQFTKEPTQDYLIEIFDPVTHKLLEKKKIQSTAVDYGTGAIYRRQPARKEMAKDGEWFAMTVVAHGNHLATWVNGIQVTDWYDHRPKSDNARTGCKLDAGHISIQGHDPTTDLSFRNLRIAAWPK